MKKLIFVLLAVALARGQTVSGGGSGNASVNSPSTNGAAFWNGTTLTTTATGGAGTLCLVSTTGGAPVWGSCAGSTTTDWGLLTNPSQNMAINVGTHTSIITVQGNTSTTNMFQILDTTGNTGTGSLFTVNTAGTSAAKPVTFTAKGTANGVQMDNTGKLAAIGTGAISADTVTGFSPASTKVLTLSNTMTQTATDGSSVAFGSGGTVTYTSNNLSVFAATTSAQLAGVLSDETGSGLAVFGTSPTIVTPTIASFTNATHNHSNAAGGGTFNTVNASTCTGTPSATTFLSGACTWTAPFTLTTTGTSGSATFSAGTLNIPQYTGGGSGCVPGGSAGQVLTDSGTGTCTSQASVTIASSVVTAQGFTSAASAAGILSLTANATPGTVVANSFGFTAPATITTSQYLQPPNATPAAHSVMVIGAPASNVSAFAYKAVPDCTDTGGNHLNFTQSTDAFSCGTSGGAGLTIGTTTITSGTTLRLLYDLAGVVSETADFTFSTHTLAGGAAAIFDMSAGVANSFKVPVIAGATSGANGVIAYDSTNGDTHVRLNGADAKVAGFTSTPANNDCAKWVTAGSTFKLDTAGGACGTGGTVTVVGAGTLTNTAFTTGGGSQTIQTPSAGSTLSSGGNAVFAGTVTTTALISGTSPCTGFTVGTGGAECFNEGTAPSAGFQVATQDGIYADSTRHAFLATYNNATPAIIVLGPASSTNTGLVSWNGTNGGALNTNANFTLTSTTLTGGASAVLDLSAASVTAGLKNPSAAGAAPTADGFSAFNTTTHRPAWGGNGSTLSAVMTADLAANVGTWFATPTWANFIAALSGGIPSLSIGSGSTACGTATGCIAMTEASTAAGGVTGGDSMRGDSTSHTFLCTKNAGSETHCNPNLPTSTTNGHAVGWSGTIGDVLTDAGAFNATLVGLGSVTNDAQTKAAIVPNTAPAAAGLLVGNAGGTAYGLVALSGDATLASTGAITVTKINGTSFAGTNGHLVSFGAANIPADSGLVAANEVNASSPGVGLCHFAGSTQTCTSSLVVNADITNSTIDLTAKVTGVLPLANGGTNANITPANGGLIYSTASALATTAAFTSKQVVLSGGAGAPTAIDFPQIQYAPAANCVNTVAGAAWSTGATPAPLCRAGTNNKDGLLSPWGGSDVAYVKFRLPNDWDSAASLDISLDLTSTDATNGHTVIMQAATACAKGDGSTTDDVAFNTAQSFSTITLNGNANRTWTATLTGATKTGCVAQSTLWVKVLRTTDTATNVGVYGLTVDMPRLLTVQAQ